MSIETLRSEVRRLCPCEVRYVAQEEAVMYNLSDDCPANIMRNHEIWEVNVIDWISENLRIQAEAHELGHLYIHESGLVRIETHDYGPLVFFILELNNALSHRFVIDTLLLDFSIEISYHLDIRAQSMNSIRQQIHDYNDEVALLYGLGLRLYDIYLTIHN